MIIWDEVGTYGGHQRGTASKGQKIGVAVELREGDQVWGVFRTRHQTGTWELVGSFPRDGMSAEDAKIEAGKFFD